MNYVFINTFDKSGAVHVRSLFSVAVATLQVYPLGALPCAPPVWQFENCPARAVADRELLSLRLEPHDTCAL